LKGIANYDWRRLGELSPALRNFTSPVDLTITYVKHLVGDRIPDQYHGMRIIDEEAVDLVMADSAFYGVFPLLLRNEPGPPVISCDTIAPTWHDPGSSELTGHIRWWLCPEFDLHPPGRDVDVERRRRLRTIQTSTPEGRWHGMAHVR
jgi:hypothetical protein